MTKSAGAERSRDLEGRTALVTGGSRGIGLAVVRALLDRGARVAFTARKEAGIEAARAALDEERRMRALGVAAHSARPEEMARAFDAAEAALGPISMIIANAATNPSFEPLVDVPLDVFQKTMDTNVTGYLVTAREGARRLRARGAPGTIVLVSSLAAERAWPGLGAYGISKSAVNMMAKVLAAELGPAGIRVNAVAPGVVRTRFSEVLWKSPEAEKETCARTPLGRIAEPQDVASAVAFLASEESRHVTGQILVIDGGLTTV